MCPCFVLVCVCVCVFFTSTDRASTIPSNLRGCQSGTWSSGQENIRGTSIELGRELKKKQDKKQEKRKEIKINTKANTRKDF